MNFLGGNMFRSSDDTANLPSPLLGIKTEIAHRPDNAAHASSSSDIKTKIDPIQLLYMRAKEIEATEKKRVQYAGIGKPNAPINYKVCRAGLEYWQTVSREASSVQRLLEQMSRIKKSTLLEGKNDEALVEEINEIVAKIDQSRAAPGNAHELTAKGFGEFYNLDPSTIKIRPENILFPIGGGGGLRAVFEVCDDLVVVQRPYYTLYVGPNSKNKLRTYDTFLKEKGKVSFGEVIEDIKKSKKKVSFVLFCNPNNPTGKVISEEEWENIVENLRSLIEHDEECCIGVDEAYIELNYSDTPSLLEFIFKKLVQIETTLLGKEREKERTFYYKLLERLVIFRSGTKALSASGLRMAAMIVFNERLRAKLEKKTQEMGSLPAHLKLAYAMAISHFNTRLQGDWLHFLNDFYREQVRHAEKRAQEIGIAIRNADDQFDEVAGTFYVCINLRCLIGFSVVEPAIQTQLVRWGLNGKILSTDVDIAYYILAKLRIMIAPLSIFGGNPEEGILRVTCSEGTVFLDKIFDKLRTLITKVAARKALSSQQAILSLSSPMGSPLLSPILPCSPVLERSKLPFEQSSVLPPQIFANYMSQYWEKIFRGAEKAQTLREEELKSGVKPCFHEVLLLMINDVVTISYNNVLDARAEKLKIRRSGHLENAIILSLVFLSKNYSGLWEEIKSISPNYELLDSIIQERNVVVIDNPKSLDFCIDRFNSKYATQNPKPYHILLADLAFEIIFNEMKENREKSPFYSDFFEIYASNSKDVLMQKKEVLRQKIIALRAAVDYSHPQGEEKDRNLIAKALNKWYGQNSISSKHVLFFSVELDALIKNVFGDREEQRRIVTWSGSDTIAEIEAIQETEKPIAILFCVFSEKIGVSLDKKQLQEAVVELKKIMLRRGNIHLVVNESCVERCCGRNINFGKESIISALLANDVFPKERLHIIRSAHGIFTTEDANISVLVTFNEEIMQTAVAESISMHVHAPADLQFAYSHALEDWMQALVLKSEYREQSEQYVRVLCKYHLWKEKTSTVENEIVYGEGNNTMYIEKGSQLLVDIQHRPTSIFVGMVRRTASAPDPGGSAANLVAPSSVEVDYGSSPLLTASFISFKKKPKVQEVNTLVGSRETIGDYPCS